MAQINKPNTYFNTKLYTGTGATQSITGVGFQPDLVWGKSRTSARSHNLTDIVRGVQNKLQTDTTLAESAITGVTSFDSDGFTIGSHNGYNELNSDFVAWNWLAGGTGVSNTDGSITSTVSASTTSGFSIVSYTGNGTAGATVGHGLGVAPKMIICKSRTQAQNWSVYHSSLGATKAIFLDGTGGEATSASYWNNTSPTSTVFTVGNSGDVNYNAGTQISYCFAEKKGFSKFGKYTGNGSADGTFVYTGFKPAMVIFKSTGEDNWCIMDNKRDSFNVMDKRLFPHLSNAESTGVSNVVDFVSNGFKLRTSDSSFNLNGQSFIYMCFAENPLVGTNNIPATAR